MAGCPRSPEDAAGFDSRLCALLAERHVPGAGVVWVSSGEVAKCSGYGIADSQTKRAVTSSTVFQAASLSKPVFALAVVGLAAQGEFDLDRPLSAYGVSPPTNDPRLDPVTGRLVLRHSSGLPNWFGNDEREMLCAHGERFTYSGIGYVYLQQCVESVVGAPIESWLAHKILGPAGMSGSAFAFSASLEEAAALAHDEQARVMEADRHVEVKVACSLYTTPMDYGRFIAYLLQAEGMLRESVSCRTRVTADVSWGLGWGVEPHARGTLAFHWGDNPGFQSFVLVDIDRRDAIAVFTNGQCGRRVYDPLVREWFGASLRCLDWLESRYAD